MSAFGRSRRQVYLDAQLWELLRAAAPHEPVTIKFGELDGMDIKNRPLVHTAETLHDAIVRDWFDQADKVKYVELLKRRTEATDAAEAQWQEWVRQAPPFSNNVVPPVPETRPAEQ